MTCTNACLFQNLRTLSSDCSKQAMQHRLILSIPLDICRRHLVLEAVGVAAASEDSVMDSLTLQYSTIARRVDRNAKTREPNAAVPAV